MATLIPNVQVGEIVRRSAKAIGAVGSLGRITSINYHTHCVLVTITEPHGRYAYKGMKDAWAFNWIETVEQPPDWEL